MFVLYYQTISDYEYIEVKLISASLDKSKLDTIRTKLIDETKTAAKIYSDRSTEIYNFYKGFHEKVKVFLTKNKQFITNGALPISNETWQNAHEETRNFFRDQAIEKESLVTFFYPDSKTKLGRSDLSEIMEIENVFFSDIPKMDTPPEYLEFPDPYYTDDSLVIDEVTVI